MFRVFMWENVVKSNQLHCQVTIIDTRVEVAEKAKIFSIPSFKHWHKIQPRLVILPNSNVRFVFVFYKSVYTMAA